MSQMGHQRTWRPRNPTSVLPTGPDIAEQSGHVGFVPILLQKSFWGVEGKFLEPLARFTRSDVREPYRFIQNRSWISVRALKAEAAARKSKDRLSRDF
jgi:hypothetical protein